MNIQSDRNSNHEFHLKMRREMNIDGVTEVISFDEQEIHLITFGGEMFIEGAEMHIDVLDVDRKIVTLTGKIDAIYYSNNSEKEKQGFFGRLFR